MPAGDGGSCPALAAGFGVAYEKNYLMLPACLPARTSQASVGGGTERMQVWVNQPQRRRQCWHSRGTSQGGTNSDWHILAGYAKMEV